MVENTPSFQPNPDLKLIIHDRSALNGKNKAVIFDHGDGKVKSSPFAQAIRQKNKKAAFTGNSPLKTTSITAFSSCPNPSAILLKITTK